MKIKKHPTMPDIFASEDGRVFRELPHSPDANGYRLMHLVSSGIRRTVRRHTIVCETYHGIPPENNVVRHKNGVPGDDRPCNLQWGTQRDNLNDMVIHGRSTRGSKNARAKLTEDQVREIKNRMAQGETQAALADEFNVSQPTLSDIKHGRTWGHL